MAAVQENPLNIYENLCNKSFEGIHRNVDFAQDFLKWFTSDPEQKRLIFNVKSAILSIRKSKIFSRITK